MMAENPIRGWISRLAANAILENNTPVLLAGSNLAECERQGTT
jgi:hypothetical protein